MVSPLRCLYAAQHITGLLLVVAATFVTVVWEPRTFAGYRTA